MKISMIKKISIKEFREIGYLQELNRQFLHPLGMALEINVEEEDGTETLGGIWDSRDDPEGIIYDLENSGSGRVKAFSEKRDRVHKLAKDKRNSRVAALNYVVEPIPYIPSLEEDNKNEDLSLI